MYTFNTLEQKKREALAAVSEMQRASALGLPPNELARLKAQAFSALAAWRRCKERDTALDWLLDRHDEHRMQGMIADHNPDEEDAVDEVVDALLRAPRQPPRGGGTPLQ